MEIDKLKLYIKQNKEKVMPILFILFLMPSAYLVQIMYQAGIHPGYTLLLVPTMISGMVLFFWRYDK